MEKLEREKWESESKAHKWKMDFQDLCQTYEVTGCNKATLYYMSALQLREQIQDNALKRLFIYAICDAGFLMDRYTDCNGHPYGYVKKKRNAPQSYIDL